MDKLKEFKEFVKQNEHVYELVKTNKYTWQQLYEYYDIYGAESQVFKKEINNNTISNRNVLNDFITATKNIDMSKVNEGLDSLKKVADIFAEFTSLKSDSNEIKDLTRKRRYRRFDQ
ncbi:MAG: hypothetical protein E7184_01570 [Erysipelotrichaceae bacterium]|nr:hypothetical protein [Erysipelotrichaceae bacterium]